MDKSWIQLKDRASEEYFRGVENFLNFSFNDDPTEKCPCRKCKNRFFLEKDAMRGHLVWNGFWQDYTYWDLHGEDPLSSPPIGGTYRSGESDVNDIDRGGDMIGMMHDALGITNSEDVLGNDQRPITEETMGADQETNKMIKLIKDAQRPLYDECENFTSLSFLIRLLNTKVTYKMTNKAVNEILSLLHEAFPNAVLPKSYYEAQKITSDMDFSYETWDACKNNCMLYRGDDKDLEKCSICDCPRYKTVDNNQGNVVNTTNKGKRIAEKRMRYFPLKPRLKRLFMSPHAASLMKWHASDDHIDDGMMRHPADSPAWKAFMENNEQFASDPRNVRLGLAADGFNPHGNMSSSHSIWPIVLIPHNLPPWLYMKQSNFILSTLIDGPDGPGDKIDVYLQPLIEELKDLWSSGVDTYDASSKEMFKLRAGLLWTINDFPAYANLSGWSTKGKFACPCCNKLTKSRWLTHGGKFCYLGHRRWLKSSHKFRRDKLAFDGEQEWDDKPPILSGTEILEQVKDIETIYKKEDVFKRREREAREKEEEKARKLAERREAKKRTRQGQVKKGKNKKGPKKYNTGKKKEDSWKKKSIFFELPYWKHNLIRHNLDVMHIEKNICDNILFTLLGTTGKSKDSIKARLDMKSMGIRKPLHPKEGESGSKRLSPAIYTMSKAQKEIFLKVLKDVKVPDGYASNISRRVHLKDVTLKGLKSHDNHILLQQLLPLAIRKALPSKVVKVLIEVTNFFRKLCSKVNRKAELEDIQERISLALCHLEKIFPPAFFDIMVHLPIHLAQEAMIGGPVQYRWMYPVERYLSTLKKYVRNRARPEGSIAQGYILDECMTFCGRYLDEDVETMTNRPSRNYDGDDNQGCHFGKVETFYLDRVTQEQAHRYVLANVDGVQHFREMHIAYLKSNMPRASDRQLYAAHNDQFSNWFKDHVEGLEVEGNTELSEEIIKLAAGPIDLARRFNGYIVNGFRFRTRGRNNSKVTSNSGVCLNAETRSYSSAKDKNPISGDVTFYGELTDIIEITYSYDLKYVVFKCDWVDNGKGKMKDEFNLTSVNFNHLLYKENKVSDEPFVLASQAIQVIYVKDPTTPDWSVALKMTSRELFDMYLDDNSMVVVPQVQPYTLQQLEETRVVNNDESAWVREGVEETIVDATTAAAAYAKTNVCNESDSDSDSDEDEDTANEDCNEAMDKD